MFFLFYDFFGGFKFYNFFCFLKVSVKNHETNRGCVFETQPHVKVTDLHSEEAIKVGRVEVVLRRSRYVTATKQKKLKQKIP